MSNFKKKFKRTQKTELKCQNSAVRDSKRQLKVYYSSFKIYIPEKSMLPEKRYLCKIQEEQLILEINTLTAIFLTKTSIWLNVIFSGFQNIKIKQRTQTGGFFREKIIEYKWPDLST